jgi:hypothetical protein
VQSFAVAGPGTVYELFSNGELEEDTVGVSRYVVDNNVRSFVLGPGGYTVDALGTNGNLQQYKGSGWTLLDQNVVAIRLGNGGYTLYATRKDGTVQQFTG